MWPLWLDSACGNKLKENGSTLNYFPPLLPSAVYRGVAVSQTWVWDLRYNGLAELKFLTEANGKQLKYYTLNHHKYKMAWCSSRCAGSSPVTIQGTPTLHAGRVSIDCVGFQWEEMWGVGGSTNNESAILQIQRRKPRRNVEKYSQSLSGFLERDIIRIGVNSSQQPSDVISTCLPAFAHAHGPRQWVVPTLTL
ncbi:hypothetical protein J6590_044940 [Homalodisca vitripennis]|nr:hypothetical protein J6590_044940 [Homalodisca vitripennis]